VTTGELHVESTESILKAAEALFAERGYERTPIQEIASLAGVASGTIIYHFKHKERLLAELAVRHLRNLHARCQEQASRGGNGLDSVLHYLDAFHAHLREHPQECAAFFKNIPRMGFEEELAQRIATADRSLSLLLECLVYLGVEDGSINSLDMSSCTRSIQAIMQGGAHMVLFRGGDARAIARDAINCARLLLTGVATKGRPHGEVSPAA